MSATVTPEHVASLREIIGDGDETSKMAGAIGIAQAAIRSALREMESDRENPALQRAAVELQGALMALELPYERSAPVGNRGVEGLIGWDRKKDDE